MTARAAFVIALAIAVQSQQPVGESPQPPNGYLFYDEVARTIALLPEYLPSLTPATAHMQIWQWRNDRWQPQTAAAGPPPRTVSAAAYDSRRHRVVLHGGLGVTGLDDTRADTWEWDGTRWHQHSDEGPGARDHHAMVFDEARAEVVMFGGVMRTPGAPRTGIGAADTWVWNGTRWDRRATDGPSPRSASMAYDAVRQQVVLVGGVAAGPGGAQQFADTWVWNGTRWRMATPAGPSARTGHAMTFDRRSGRVLLWGGRTADGHVNDFWAWDGAAWTAITTTEPRPGPRIGAQMAYDASQQRAILFGGHARVDGKVIALDDLWSWDGERWTQLSAGTARTPGESERSQKREQRVFLGR